MKRLPLVGVLACALAACAGGGGEDDDLPGLGRNIGASFVAAQDANCPGADMLTMQSASVMGSIVNVDLVVTDCDGSLALSGLAFELTFDPAVAGFVGCSNGSLFPANQLVPGTPECTVSGGNVLGTISLLPPRSSVVAGSGTASVVRLTFSVTQKGVSSPVGFTGTDTISSTALFFLDPSSQSVAVYPLGAGYFGGTFVSN